MIALKRRWFRFSLRGLFLAVTVAAISLGWIAYHLNWIRQRHAVMDAYGQSYRDENCISPGMLWLFGERGVRSFDVPWIINGRNDEVERIHRLFPEALLSLYFVDDSKHAAAETSPEAAR